MTTGSSRWEVGTESESPVVEPGAGDDEDETSWTSNPAPNPRAPSAEKPGMAMTGSSHRSKSCEPPAKDPARFAMQVSATPASWLTPDNNADEISWTSNPAPNSRAQSAEKPARAMLGRGTTRHARRLACCRALNKRTFAVMVLAAVLLVAGIAGALLGTFIGSGESPAMPGGVDTTSAGAPAAALVARGLSATIAMPTSTSLDLDSVASSEVARAAVANVKLLHTQSNSVVL